MLVSISTPIRRRLSTSLCTMVLGSRNSGIPYISTPPAVWKASNTVTAYPRRARSPAQVRPEGPEPTTATLWPLRAGFSVRSALPAASVSICRSATNRSNRPMATGSPLTPRTHLASHWVSLRAYAPAHRRQGAGLRDGMISVLIITGHDFFNKVGNLDIDRAAGNTGTMLAVKTALCLVDRHFLGISQGHFFKVCGAAQGFLLRHRRLFHLFIDSHCSFPLSIPG